LCHDHSFPPARRLVFSQFFYLHLGLLLGLIVGFRDRRAAAALRTFLW
jgi:hypothetical protein